MDELRNHDARPNAHEREWMSANPFSILVRLVALAGLAVAIGVSATYVGGSSAPASVASARP